MAWAERSAHAGATPAIIPPTPMALSAGTRLGVYEIVSILGAGGMGEVYRACVRYRAREFPTWRRPVLVSETSTF
jgi:hypothetical protein